MLGLIHKKITTPGSLKLHLMYYNMKYGRITQNLWQGMRESMRRSMRGAQGQACR